jgi:phenylalanyl-tRNA synthetase beta chain
MKISRNWLQMHFDTPLPDAQAISDALTFHAFEIDGIEINGEDSILDVKVTPNRGHDCLSYRGIAKEVSAILEIPMKADALKTNVTLEPQTKSVKVTISEPSLCYRFTAALITGVKVAPSPEWLRAALESMGQRSINNVVDATNFVMFNLGQPLHAFDAGKLKSVDGVFAFDVRRARAGEKIMALDNKEYELNESMLVVSDKHSDISIGVAGVKGGLPAAVDESTQNIIIEAANFNSISVRKTAAALKLRTDASARFEQVLAPELAAYGTKAVVELILQLAGGSLHGFVDEYPVPQKIDPVSVTVSKVNAVLGTQIPQSEMVRALTRLDLSHVVQGETLTVTPRFERLDLVIPEDLVEEIGRIVGYDKVVQSELSLVAEKPALNQNFARIEYAREHMIAEGFSEVYTSVFAERGEREVLNKVGGEKPFMRASIIPGITEALNKNVRIKDGLGLKKVKLFEIGTVWSKQGEEIMVATAEEKGEIKEYKLSDIPAPESYAAGERPTDTMYKAFSRYPFIVRDIALWVPKDTEPVEVREVILANAGALVQRIDLFDTFVKGERTSLAFRIVFQSFDKTLTDVEVNAVMDRVQAALKAKGYEIR